MNSKEKSIRIHQKSRLDRLVLIKHTLSGSELLEFENSCFGGLLEIYPKSKFQGQLAHAFVERMIKTNTKNELWFRVNNKRCRFSLHEFALMTGLNCGNNTFIPESVRKDNTLRVKYFDGLEKITVDMLQDKFEKMEKCKDRLKLAMLLFLEGILLAPESKTCISLDHFGIANFLDLFNAHSWGRISYEYTILFFLKRMEERKGKECSDTWWYSLYGFIWAFQYWIYEAFPEFRGHFASQNPNTTYPRMRNWKVDDLARGDKVANIFAELEIVNAILDATDEERQQEYMNNIFQYNDTCPRVQKWMRRIQRSADDVIEIEDSMSNEVDNQVGDETEPSNRMEDVNQGNSNPGNQPNTEEAMKSWFETQINGMEGRLMRYIDQSDNSMKSWFRAEMFAMEGGLRSHIDQSNNSMKYWFQVELSAMEGRIRSHIDYRFDYLERNVHLLNVQNDRTGSRR